MKGLYMVAFIGRPMPVIALTAAGTYYTDWARCLQQESIGSQLDFINVSGVVGTVEWEFRSHDYASACPFQVSGTTYSHTIAAASGVIGPGAGTGKLTFKSLDPDFVGSEISVVLAGGGTAGAETVAMVTTTASVDGFGKKVTSRVITVTMQSGASTAAQIKTALEKNAGIAAVLSTTVSTSGAMVTGSVQLSGGGVFVDFNTASPQVRAKIIITTGAAGAKVRPYFVAKS
jgi:hypothetical protein